MAAKGTRVKYTGPGNRFISRDDAEDGRYDRDYEWTAENGHIQRVTDKDLLENLETYPYPQWEFLDEAQARPDKEPVTQLTGVGPAYADMLAEQGVLTIGDLAKASKAKAETLATKTGLTRPQVDQLIEAAQTAVNKE